MCLLVIFIWDSSLKREIDRDHGETALLTVSIRNRITILALKNYGLARIELDPVLGVYYYLNLSIYLLHKLHDYWQHNALLTIIIQLVRELYPIPN